MVEARSDFNRLMRVLLPVVAFLLVVYIVILWPSSHMTRLQVNITRVATVLFVTFVLWLRSRVTRTKSQNDKPILREWTTDEKAVVRDTERRGCARTGS